MSDATEFFRKPSYKVACWKCVVKCISGGISSVLTSMKGLDWLALSMFDRVCIVLGAVVSMTLIIDAFLDNTMAQLKAQNNGGTPKP